ncbi:MAG: amidase [Hyphomicrobiales bacterium]|nr:amidase [Hyphomicrobiales bacterium]
MLRPAPAIGLNKLTASEIARATISGAATCEDVVRNCLARIEAREKDIHAFASIDSELALAQARRLDRSPTRGPLHGVPVGVKDIIDTCDQPTEMGSPIYAGHRPATDAACVALVRAAGAVIIGKTVTCEFAGMAPGITTNPFDTARTPGGSSSGSGAAVADMMVPAAFGTQTGGSVLRPAAYCGVFGFKPTFGAFNRRGVYPAAESLDTIGLITRSLDDIELISAVLELRRPTAPTPLAGAPRVGLCRTPLCDKAQPETVAAIEDAASRLAGGGASVREIVLPPAFAGLRNAARETVNNYERAAAMAWEWASHRERISARLRQRIESGRSTAHEQYLAALRLGDDCRGRLGDVFREVDILLTPCTNGEPPRGLDETGDPGFQAIWTILHVPTVTLPTHRSPSGLPVGIQLVAPRDRDRTLIAAARWVWQQLGKPELIGYQG